MGFVLRTAAPVPAPGAAAGAAPGPAAAALAVGRSLATPRLSHTQAEQTVCRNSFLSANSLGITNPSRGRGRHVGAFGPALGFTEGETRVLPQRHLVLGVR